MLRNPTGAGVLYAFFCAANAVAITPGTKNSALCCFLNVPFKSLIAGKQKTHNANNACVFFMVGVTGFEPMASWSRTMRATICATPR